MYRCHRWVKYVQSIFILFMNIVFYFYIKNTMYQNNIFRHIAFINYCTHVYISKVIILNYTFFQINTSIRIKNNFSKVFFFTLLITYDGLAELNNCTSIRKNINKYRDRKINHQRQFNENTLRNDFLYIWHNYYDRTTYFQRYKACLPYISMRNYTYK